MHNCGALNILELVWLGCSTGRPFLIGVMMIELLTRIDRNAKHFIYTHFHRGIYGLILYHMAAMTLKMLGINSFTFNMLDPQNFVFYWVWYWTIGITVASIIDQVKK